MNALRNEGSRVLIIANTPSPDRTPTLDRLARLGLDIHVIYLRPGGEQHGWGNVHIGHSHVIAGSKFRAIALIMDTIMAGEVATIVAYGYRHLPYAVALTLARARRMNVVVRSDTNMDAIVKDKVYVRWVRRRIARALVPRDCVSWAIGSRNAEFWREEIGLTNIEMIPFDTPEIPRTHEVRSRVRDRRDPLRILYVGRLIPEKRVQDAFAAVQLIGDRIPWRLTVVGAGPEKERLEELRAGDARISLVGAKTHRELADFYSDADVLVLPSSYEPWGLVVNEALAFGVRVLATEAVGSAVDILEPDTGALFPVGDAIALSRELVVSAEITVQPARAPEHDSAALMKTSLDQLRRTPRRSTLTPLSTPTVVEDPDR